MNDYSKKETNIEDSSYNKQKAYFDLKKSTSYEPETFLLDEDLLFEVLQPLNRIMRSKSHVVFQYRPEFVPKPKAKFTKVCPSPMRLQCKYDKINDDTCLLDSKSSFESKHSQTYSNQFSICDLRRELHQIKSVGLTNKSKDYEDILTNPISLKRKKRRSFFSKAIKNYLEDQEARKEEEEYFKSNQIEFSPIKQKTRQRCYSILSILEYAAVGNLGFRKSKSTLL